MSIHRDSLLFGVPPGGIGRSDLPAKNVTFTYLVRTWVDRNQPRPSTP